YAPLTNNKASFTWTAAAANCHLDRGVGTLPIYASLATLAKDMTTIKYLARSKAKCDQVGGTMQQADYKTWFCAVNGATCPAGMKRLGNWTKTVANSCLNP